MPPIRPFSIRVTDDDLADLHARLERTRFARPAGPAGTTGWEPSRLRELVDRWAGGYDWRAEERRLNAYPQYVNDDGVHFVHVRAEVPGDELPILLAHGWPSSFVEMLPLAELLATTRDVVVPSLPGFLFSAPPPRPWTRSGTAETYHQLMTDLGYGRYAVFGGDIGGTVAAWMAASHPEAVAALHMIHPLFPASFDEPPLTPEEQAFLDAEEVYDETDGGYSAIMITRPDTIAASLVDSPAGLLAWIADKWRDWSDCGGDLRRRLTDDQLLTLVTLYWVTGSIDTSMLQYVDFDHNPPRPPIEVPAAFTISAEPGMTLFPRAIAERSCTQIVHWSEPGRGGHFLAWEEPELMAEEISGVLAGRR